MSYETFLGDWFGTDPKNISFSKPESMWWYYNTTGECALLEEPDFDEVPEVDELCEYCGSSGGFPTVLGVTTVILCSDCQVFRTDEIAYDIASI